MSDDLRDEGLIWTPAYFLALAANFDKATGEVLLDDELSFLARPFVSSDASLIETVLVFTDRPSAEDYLARATPEDLEGNPSPIELPTDRHLAWFLHWVRWKFQIDHAVLDMLPPSRAGRPVPIDAIVHEYLSHTDTLVQ